jgi:hypothetical protein
MLSTDIYFTQAFDSRMRWFWLLLRKWRILTRTEILPSLNFWAIQAAFSCKVDQSANKVVKNCIWQISRMISQNAEFCADFKADEKVRKGLPEKSYNPTVVLIISKNGKTANFLHFLLMKFLGNYCAIFQLFRNQLNFLSFMIPWLSKIFFLPFLYFFKTLKPNAARMAQNMGKIFLSTCFSSELYLVIKNFTLLNSTAFFL